jgi:hypothetical protein
MVRIKRLLKLHHPVVVLMGIILTLTAIPVLDIYMVVGDAWQGIPPTFTDETFYDARVQTVVEGNPIGSHPYFLEHSNDPPLVIFGGAWINAIPQLAGLSFNAARLFNFILWSLLFAATVYWLFMELRVPPWVAVFGTVFLYLQSYSHVWRPTNLQPVYPFYFLFYVTLIRLVHEQSRKNVILVGITTGAMFYLFAFMWQVVVITLGLLFLYAFVQKNRMLLKATLLSLLIGGSIGLPVLLYALWLSHASPYFWESVGRLGLVNTHLPMAEVIYSGGWVGIVLALLAFLYWRKQVFREDKNFVPLVLFISVSGLGLWIMQGSNIITGKLLETGEHVRLLIQPWLVFSTIGIGVFLWTRRRELSRRLVLFSVTTLMLLSGASVYFAYQRFSHFIPTNVDRELWRTEQLYAKPFAWLQNNEESPVVVWSDPHDFLSTVLPVFTRHFTLYTYFGLLELVPEGEIRERYLVSQYFNNPTVTELKSDSEVSLYLGRHDFPHYAKTLERRIKTCRILFFWDKNKDCGTPSTPQQLLGDTFFEDLEDKFLNDIQPNIKAYLTKYHISYILKDKILNPKYHPEILGAVRVYTDDRYEIWHL